MLCSVFDNWLAAQLHWGAGAACVDAGSCRPCCSTSPVQSAVGHAANSECLLSLSIGGSAIGGRRWKVVDRSGCMWRLYMLYMRCAGCRCCLCGVVLLLVVTVVVCDASALWLLGSARGHELPDHRLAFDWRARNQTQVPGHFCTASAHKVKLRYCEERTLFAKLTVPARSL